jgi:replication-associated recombination protein RarA
MTEALGLFTPPEPLAARMRPRTLDELVGQSGILGPGKPLGDAIRRGDVGSIILWGPPGTGKTTLARLIAHYTDRQFVGFSAVTEGVVRVREILKEAEERRRLGRGTILFCDEIHRFNRAIAAWVNWRSTLETTHARRSPSSPTVTRAARCRCSKLRRSTLATTAAWTSA